MVELRASKHVVQFSDEGPGPPGQFRDPARERMPFPARTRRRAEHLRRRSCRRRPASLLVSESTAASRESARRRCALWLMSRMMSRSVRSECVASRKRRLTSKSSLRRSPSDTARYASATSASTDTVIRSSILHTSKSLCVLQCPPAATRGFPFESSSDTPPLARTAPAKSRNSSNVSMKLDFPDALGPTRTFSDRRSKKSMSGGNDSSPRHAKSAG